MKTNEVMKVIDEHLQEVNDSKEKRIERIKELLDFLNYNLRFTELSDDEKRDFISCVEGSPELTDGMRETLKSCKTEEKKNYYIEMWARSTYFRRCAWLQYLCGEIKDKPLL